MATKAEIKAALMKEICTRCADVDEEFRPSVFQYNFLREYVDWEDGCDPDGYFLGRCMLGKTHIARYNFLKGVMRCDPDEDRPSCHDGMGRTISMVRAQTMQNSG